MRYYIEAEISEDDCQFHYSIYKKTGFLSRDKELYWSRDPEDIKRKLDEILELEAYFVESQKQQYINLSRNFE